MKHNGESAPGATRNKPDQNPSPHHAATTEKRPVALVVPHTHWDREWRYPAWRTRALLVGFMEQLLGMLETDADYRCFIMDGQCVVIEDYLEVCPGATGRLRPLIEAGRLAIGPWYTLPDLYPLDGECLIRNLLKGIRLSHRLGGRHLGIGYNTFGWGQTAQFPQIYRGFGFDFLIAAKRVSEQRAPNCEFYWEAPDGSRLLTSRLGDEARANGFFNTYIPYSQGMSYHGDDYRFRWGKTGQVYHDATPANQDNDYFRIDSTVTPHPDALPRDLQRAWNAMRDSLLPNFRLILCGSDFTSAQPLLTQMLRDANALGGDVEYRLGTLEEYAAALHSGLDHDKVPVVRGELRDGPASNVSANALATRLHIKQLNKRAENALLRQAEPLAALLSRMGEPYPTEFLRIGWRELLLSHPHDSLNGVTQDKTTEDTLHHLRQALEIGEVVYEEAYANLLRRIDLSAASPDEQLLLIVNPLPFPVREVMKLCIDTPVEDRVWEVGMATWEGEPLAVQEVGRQERTCPVNDPETRPWPFSFDRHTIYTDPGEIPAGGYSVLRVTHKRRFARVNEWWPEMRTSRGEDIARAPHTLENEFMKVTARGDGSIDVIDKLNQRTLTGLHVFEDTGDVGDYWAYYPPYENQTILSTGQPARIWLEDNGPLSATLGIEITMQVPVRAEIPEKYYRGECRRSRETKPLVITSRLTLQRGSRRLAIHTTVENTVEDHRLRVLFPTGLATDRAWSAGHFNVDERPIYPLRDANGEFFPEMQTQPQQIFVDVTDGAAGFGIVNNCLTEYQLLDDDQRTLALTLLRGMRNRICTEHRSTGWFRDQQGGQMLRTMEYDYALVMHAGDWVRGELYREALAFNAPPKPLQVSAGKGGTLPPRASLFSIEPANLILSAFKQAESGENLIMRLYNPTRAALTGTVRFEQPIAAAHRLNLNEDREATLATTPTQTLTLEIPPGKILTLELEG